MTQKFYPPVVGLSIPDKTTEEMLKDLGTKEAVGALADVITGMQENVDSKLLINNLNNSKNIKKD